MAKISKERWLLAEDLFLAGKTLEYIVKETRISKSTISEKSKKLGWIKGQNEHIIMDGVRLAEDKSNLTEQQTNINDQETNRIIKSRQETNTIARMGQNLIANKFKKAIKTNSNPKPEEITMQDIKAGIAGNDQASITLGVNPRHANSQINMQQNNDSSTKVIEIVDV